MATGVEDLKDLVTSIKFPIVNWNKDGSLRVLDLPESKAEYEKLFRLGHDLFESRSIVSQERLSNDPLFWIFIFKQLIMLKKNYSSTDEDTTSKPVAIQLVQSVLSNEKVHHEQVDFTCSPTLLLLGSIKAIESIFKDSFRKSPFLEDFCFLHAGHRTRRISLQHEYDETNKDSKSERYFLVEAFLELSLYFNLNVLRNVIWVEMILILLDDWRIPLKTQGLNLIQKLANENEFLVTYKSVLMESLFESTLSDPLPYMKQCLETFIFLGKNFKDTESEEAINDFIIGFLLRELTFANYSPEWFNVDEAFWTFSFLQNFIVTSLSSRTLLFIKPWIVVFNRFSMEPFLPARSQALLFQLNLLFMKVCFPIIAEFSEKMLVSLCQFVKYEGVLYPENLSILKSNYQFLSSHRTDLRTLIEMTRDETLMGIFLQ